MKHKWLAALTACTMLVSLAGCAGTPADSSSGAAPTTPPAATTPAPTEAPGNVNLFTGENTIKPGAPTRPVAIMIPNNPPAMPQIGLDKADLFVESETEGGITRLMVVFASVNDVPALIGPIRSARTHFVNLALSLDAVYVHFGGSTLADKLLASSGINRINGMNDSTIWRDKSLLQKRHLEYTAVTGVEKLSARIKARGFATTTNRQSPYTFADNQTGSAANELQIYLSGAQTSSFRYDAAKNVYHKIYGTLDKGSAHKMMDGTQLAVSNVIVMYDEKFNEDAGHISFRLQSGTGLLASGGVSRPIKWTRTGSQLSFMEENGQPLAVSRGKTYIGLLSSAYQGKTVVK